MEQENQPVLSSASDTLLAGLADLIFPPKCIQCGVLLKISRAHSFCRDCFSEITFIRSPICPCCGRPIQSEAEEDHLCGQCIASEPCFSVARAVGIYEKVLLEAIHRFKYKRDFKVGNALGKLMAFYTFPLFEPRSYDLIMPVPLHRKRLRQRGFNQAVILAKEIAGHYGLELETAVLKRRKHTLPQFDLGRSERGQNVKDAFEVRRKDKLEGRRVLLVDDVYTTGSTIRECARTLMEAGAEEIAVLTLARTL